MFLARPEYEALYGGAAGGGKSDALLMEALRQVHISHYTAIIFRKTYSELSELVERSRIIYGAAYPEAVYLTSEHYWLFKSGARIYFGNMQHTADRHKYQGRSYDFIGFDELTHFQEAEYTYMFSRNRPTGPGTRVYIRAATNPGGIGHGWVKRRFITPAPPLTTIVENYKVVDPDGGERRLSRDRIFIPASVFDNQELLTNFPAYLANLSMLPEAEKQALLYGSWDSFSGQVFAEWRDAPAMYSRRRYTHVIDPFPIPAHWRVYRGFDFGYAKPFSVGWFAVDEEGRIYHIREFYGSLGGDRGLKMHPVQIAAAIREIEDNDPNLRGRHIIGVADPSIFDESRGESVARMMERHPSYIHFSPGDNTRIAGKMQYHYRLAFDETGLPLLQVFKGCREFIRTLAALVYDEGRPEDVDSRGEDHIYDMCRYVLMEQPLTPPVKAVAEWREDPLDLRR